MDQMFGGGWLFGYSTNSTGPIMQKVEAYSTVWSWDAVFAKFRFKEHNYKAYVDLTTASTDMSKSLKASKPENQHKVWEKVKTELKNNSTMRMAAVRRFVYPGSEQRSFKMGESRNWTAGFFDYSTKIWAFSPVQTL